MKKCVLTLAILIALAFASTPASSAAPGEEPLRFGTLPVIQALPVFVAQELGLFKAEGLEVDVVTFRTGLEKDVAMSAGKLDGYFGDLFTSIILNAGGTDVKIAARNYLTGEGKRMFGIVTGPKSELKSLKDLAGVQVAISSNTIIEYVTRTLLQEAGVPEEQITPLEVRNIPVRFQMVMAGQVPAATLPEPLVTLVESKGGKVLADDGQSKLSSTVFIFSSETLKSRPEDVTKFMNAVNEAVGIINSSMDGVRDIMIRNCNVPEPLKDKYPVPKFPLLAAPDQKRVEGAVEWLHAKGVIKTRPSYEQLVDSSLVPQ